MKKILIEKVIIFMLLSIIALVIRINEVKPYKEMEKKFIDDFTTKMENYGYDRYNEFPSSSHLEYINGDNYLNVYYNCGFYNDKLEVSSIFARIYFNLNDEFNKEIDFLNNLSDVDLEITYETIEKMINELVNKDLTQDIDGFINSTSNQKYETSNEYVNMVLEIEQRDPIFEDYDYMLEYKVSKKYN